VQRHQVQPDDGEHRRQVPHVHGHRPAGEPAEERPPPAVRPALDRRAQQEDRAHLSDRLGDDRRRRRVEVGDRVARHADHAPGVGARDDEDRHRPEPGREPGPQRASRHGRTAGDPVVGVGDAGQERHGPHQEHVRPRGRTDPRPEPQQVDDERSGRRHHEGAPPPPPPHPHQRRHRHEQRQPHQEEPQRLRRHEDQAAHGATGHPAGDQPHGRDGPDGGEHRHGPGDRAQPAAERRPPPGGRGGVLVGRRRAGGEEEQGQHLHRPRQQPGRAVVQGVADDERAAVPRRLGHQPVQRDDAERAERADGVHERVPRGRRRPGERRSGRGAGEDGGHGGPSGSVMLTRSAS